MGIFKENNPKSTSTAAFILDKDMKEDAAITSVFPHARILLCQFHVIKWFQGKKNAFTDLTKEDTCELEMTIKK